MIPDFHKATVNKIKNGTTLFKLVIMRFTIDTRLTVTVIRKKVIEPGLVYVHRRR